jgi:TFIIF-interacting CTD phosphatase-like protein
MQKPFKLPAKLPPVISGRKPIFKQTKPNRKVLVLDLDETIYNYVNKAKSEGHNVVQIPGLNCVLYLRPGAKEFLLRARKKFDLAVFTKAKKEFADEALKLLELGKILKPNNEKNTFRLYRDSFEQGKDLRKFGFDLNKIILIDDTSIVNFQPNAVSLHGKR